MEQKEINYNGSRLSYKVSGQGSAIVLLHGFGEDSTVWRNQETIFPDHRLLIPDLPGSGSSAIIVNMSMEGLAQSVLAVLDAEQIDRCVLIGHSMGGYITLAFAEHFGERLTGFGLFHST